MPSQCKLALTNAKRLFNLRLENARQCATQATSNCATMENLNVSAPRSKWFLCRMASMHCLCTPAHTFSALSQRFMRFRRFFNLSVATVGDDSCCSLFRCPVVLTKPRTPCRLIEIWCGVTTYYTRDHVRIAECIYLHLWHFHSQFQVCQSIQFQNKIRAKHESPRKMSWVRATTVRVTEIVHKQYNFNKNIDNKMGLRERNWRLAVSNWRLAVYCNASWLKCSFAIIYQSSVANVYRCYIMRRRAVGRSV